MNFVLIALICLGALACQLAAAIAPEDSQVWLQYKQKHGKLYGNQVEEAKRFEIFMANKQRVERQNAMSTNFTLALNHMSDWTPEEYANINGFKLDEEERFEMISREELEQLIGSDAPVPEELDWRQHEGRVSAVQNQAQCGSCWAFATAGLLEGQELAQKMESLIPLSVQEIVDCSDSNSGCFGGTMSKALSDLSRRVRGLEPASEYPYDGFYGVCRKEERKYLKQLRVGGYKMLPAGDEKTLKRVLATYGPVAVGFQASQLFHMYRDGIFADDKCLSGHANHAVLIVGFGRDRAKGMDFWIVKNSWSSQWGEAGYFRMKAGENMCGIADLPTLAVFQSAN